MKIWQHAVADTSGEGDSTEKYFYREFAGVGNILVTLAQAFVWKVEEQESYFQEMVVKITLQQHSQNNNSNMVCQINQKK